MGTILLLFIIILLKASHALAHNWSTFYIHALAPTKTPHPESQLGSTNRVEFVHLDLMGPMQTERIAKKKVCIYMCR